MLSKQVIHAVEELLRKTTNQRAVARRLGISRGAVGSIASGKHPWQNGYQPPTHNRRATLPGPVGRCPSCRRRVRLPCLACAILALPSNRTTPDDPAPVVIGLDFRGDVEMERRYRQCRKRAEWRARRRIRWAPDLPQIDGDPAEDDSAATDPPAGPAEG